MPISMGSERTTASGDLQGYLLWQQEATP